VADHRSANRIKGKWSAGEAAIVAWLQIPSAHHAELLATLDFDGLVVDLQHSVIEFDTAVEMFTAIELSGCEPLVRASRNDTADIGKLLDGGASGVIAPLINTAEEADALLRAIHYPPTGSRSLGPRRPLLRWGADYRTHTLELAVSLAMIETQSGLDDLQGILSVPHLDGVFVGPSDLALALGRDPAADPTDQLVLEAIRHVRDNAHAAGKRVGIFCGSQQGARERLVEGFDLVSIGTDLQMLAGAASAGLELVRS
jgi:4-hydroxy-2-oxoheptanedioate aldolase